MVSSQSSSTPHAVLWDFGHDCFTSKGLFKYTDSGVRFLFLWPRSSRSLSSDGILSVQVVPLWFGFQRLPHRIKEYHFRELITPSELSRLIVYGQSTQQNGFDGPVWMKTNEVYNFNGMEVVHQRLDNPTISRDIPMEEAVVVLHSVTSGDFMLRDLVVVFRSVNSEDLCDGWSCVSNPHRKLWKTLTWKSGPFGPAPVNSGELRDGFGRRVVCPINLENFEMNDGPFLWPTHWSTG